MDWLLFFSSLPSKPVGNRVKVWRKLTKSGAVQLKNSVYVLPAGEQHAEFLQWLVGEIAGMGGEAAFARVQRVETVPDAEVIALFDRRKANEYRATEAALDVFERRLENARQGGRAASGKGLVAQLDKLARDFGETRRTDFFFSASGRNLEARIAHVRAALGSLTAQTGGASPAAVIARRFVEDYRGKRWATRRAPFADRMACAWLIRRFIDSAAAFTFVDEAGAAADAVTFDVAGGEFSHVGDLCTFEVLVRAFGFSDAALATLAEIIHDLDVTDDRSARAEAAGVEAILAGIRRTARDDADALERGMAIFAMLYAAKTAAAGGLDA